MLCNLGAVISRWSLAFLQSMNTFLKVSNPQIIGRGDRPVEVITFLGGGCHVPFGILVVMWTHNVACREATMNGCPG